MMEDTIGMVVLLLVGVVALVVGSRLFMEYMAKKAEEKVHHFALWSMSLLVLFVSGVLIILFDWEILDSSLVPVVAALVPIGFGTGMLYAAYPDKHWGRWLLIYSVVGVHVLLAVRLTADETSYMNSIAVMATHIPNGLVMVIVPAKKALDGEVDKSAWFFSLGGFAISAGGMLLAIATKGASETITAEFVFSVLPYLLLLVGVLLVLGIALPKQWRPENCFVTKLLG